MVEPAFEMHWHEAIPKVISCDKKSEVTKSRRCDFNICRTYDILRVYFWHELYRLLYGRAITKVLPVSGLLLIPTPANRKTMWPFSSLPFSQAASLLFPALKEEAPPAVWLTL